MFAVFTLNPEIIAAQQLTCRRHLFQELRQSVCPSVPFMPIYLCLHACALLGKQQNWAAWSTFVFIDFAPAAVSVFNRHLSAFYDLF